MSEWQSSEHAVAYLERAEIDYMDDGGRVADFHALLHSFISALATGGVAPKIAQSLARTRRSP